MSVNEVIMDRNEFVNHLAGRVEDFTDIAKALRFLDAAFILQNDAGRPAYIFSVSEKVSDEDMELVKRVFVDIGVIGVFLPSDLMNKFTYEGTVTPDSFNIGGKNGR